MGILNKRRACKIYNNLSEKECEVLTELKNDVIKPANKGGAICILKTGRLHRRH